jgi:hypothetical protein
MDNDCALLEALHEAWAALARYLARNHDLRRASCAARVAELLSEAIEAQEVVHRDQS